MLLTIWLLLLPVLTTAFDANLTNRIEKERMDDLDSSSSSCSSCSIRSLARSRSLSLIKSSLLSRLGFSHPPNTTGRTLPEVPRELLDRWEVEEMQRDDSGDEMEEEEGLEKEGLIVFATKGPKLRHSWKHHHHFSISAQNRQRVRSALLYVWLERPVENDVTIKVYKVHRGSNSDTPILIQRASLNVRSDIRPPKGQVDHLEQIGSSTDHLSYSSRLTHSSPMSHLGQVGQTNQKNQMGQMSDLENLDQMSQIDPLRPLDHSDRSRNLDLSQAASHSESLKLLDNNEKRNTQNNNEERNFHRKNNQQKSNEERIYYINNKEEKNNHQRNMEKSHQSYINNNDERNFEKNYQNQPLNYQSTDKPSNNEERNHKKPKTISGWIKIDITSLVSEWFKSPKDNLGIVVNATGGRVIDRTPFVDISLTNPPKRRKRSIGLNCNEDEQQTLCCRYPLTVDFEEFGWDFIIAPKRYVANFCAGDCPHLLLQRHAHTHLAQLAGGGGPCCSARKLSGMSMLYFDQELNVVYGRLQGMVVERCGCS